MRAAEMRAWLDGIVTGLALPEQRSPGRTRLDSSAAHRAGCEHLLRSVWSALARPGALASNFRLVESRREIDPSRWRTSRVRDGEILHTALRAPFLHRAVRGGATLVISHLEDLDGEVMALCEALEYRLRSRVWANCYLTASAGSAFEAHRDDHHVLVLQLLGRKRWEADKGPGGAGNGAGGTGSGPGDRRIALAADALDITMEPGMCLALPRGTAHRVSGRGEPAVHLTVGYEEPPSGAGPRAGAPGAERRSGSSFPFALDGRLTEHSRIRWADRFPPLIEADGGAHLTVTTLGRQLKLDARLDRAIGLLAQGGHWEWQELTGVSGLPAEDLRAFIDFGVRNDFIICEG